MKKVVFIGSKELGFSVFKKIHQLDNESMQACITFDDHTDTRSCFRQFCKYCEDNKIQLYVLNKPKDIRQIILELHPDLCFVLGWYFIIDSETLSSVPMGFIGIHNSILPKYRGFAPLVWMMINGEDKAGFSLFNLSNGMDTGDIWATGEVFINDEDYIEDVLRKINIEILAMLDNKYLQIINQQIKPYKQPETLPSYCARRTEEDGIIDWHLPAKKVYDFIRAQSHPYPGAYTLVKGKRLSIWKAVLNDFVYYGTPGQVGQIYANGDVLIVCGDYKGIILQDITYDGEQLKPSIILNSLTIRL